MKQLIAGIAVAGLVLGGVMLAKGAKDDADVAAGVVDAMTAEQLTGPVKPNLVNGPADLTAEVVAAVVEDLKDPEAHGGLLKIAMAHGCSQGQVKLIQQKIQERLQELNPVDPIIEHP